MAAVEGPRVDGEAGGVHEGRQPADDVGPAHRGARGGACEFAVPTTPFQKQRPECPPVPYFTPVESIAGLCDVLHLVREVTPGGGGR